MREVYTCNPCDRDFSSAHALDQHLKFSVRHEYCWRCRRSFASFTAWEQHLAFSNRHHECSDCDHDAESREDLVEHLQQEHSRYPCGRCSYEFRSSWDLKLHERDAHHLCIHCDRFFETSGNLRAHLITHMPRNVECLDCYQRFSSKSAMVLHLEGRYCPGSDLDEDSVTWIALRCRASKRYRSGDRRYPFECPVCPSQFRVISALLQHAESNACDASLDPGTSLDRFLSYLAKF